MKHKTVVLILLLAIMATSILIGLYCTDKDLLDTYQEASRVPIVTYLGPNNSNYNLLSEASPTVESNIVLKIVFDMKMDSLSVQNALKLYIMNNNQPVPQDFVLFWRGQNEADIMIMQVDGILQPEKRYWIKLDVTAKTIYGRNINASIDIYFNVSQDMNNVFKVALVTPAISGTSSVSYCGNNYVQIQFSKRTDQQTVVDGFKLYESSSLVNGNISPVNGFLDDKNFKYELNGGYNPNSEYTVVVDKSVLDKTGKPLEIEFTSTFTTVPTDSTVPTVSFISPTNQSSPITLQFSEQMMYNSNLLSSIVISSSDGDIIPVTDSNSEYDASNRLKVQSPTLLKMSPVAYSIIVGTAGQDVGCNNIVGTNFSFSVTTPDTTPPVVEMTTPANGATDIGVNSNITIYFSEAMNQAETSNALSLYQGTNLLSINTSWSADDTLIITPVSALNLGNTYTVKILTSAQDISGNGLARDYVFSFNTLDGKLLIGFISPTYGESIQMTSSIYISGTFLNNNPSCNSTSILYKIDNIGNWINVTTIGFSMWTNEPLDGTSIGWGFHSISVKINNNCNMNSYNSTSNIFIYGIGEAVGWIGGGSNGWKTIDGAVAGSSYQSFNRTDGYPLVDVIGNIFVADPLNNRIDKWDRLGNALGWIGNGYNGWQTNSVSFTNNLYTCFLYPSSLKFDSLENIYVADANNNRVCKWSSNGFAVGWIGGGNNGWKTTNGSIAGSSYQYFSGPFGIDLDPTGNIYIAEYYNNRISKWDNSGNCIGWIGGGSNGWKQITGAISGDDYQSFRMPTDVAIDSFGFIFIIDWNNNRISKWDNSGNAIGWIGGGSNGWKIANGAISGNTIQHFNAMDGICFDQLNNIIVADSINNRIVKWDSSGNAIGWIGGGSNGWKNANGTIAGSSYQSFNCPQGVFIDRNGYLYVSDTINNRVCKWKY